MENFTQQPQRGVITQTESGRSCPYCRFPLKEGGEMVACGACGAAHHADCWQDNSGCAVVACVGAGTEKAATSTPVPPTFAPSALPFGPPPPPAPPDWATQAQQPSGSGRNVMWLVAAVVLLSVAIGGVAVAMVLGGSGSKGDRSAATPRPTVTAEPRADTSATEINPASAADGKHADTTAAAQSPDGTPSDLAMNGALPAVNETTMASDVESMLIEHHRDIVNGDYHAAWALLSKRKQSQYKHEYGYSKWAANQATLTPYLNPSGLKVSIEDTDRSTGVVRVKLKGMSWSKPGARCANWSGVTWVKFENGHWTYDPGYSTTPQRTRDWKDRFPELLGGRC